MKSLEWIATLAAPQGELTNVQRNGRESLLGIGFPSRKLEHWRLTDFKRLENLLELPISKGIKDSSSIRNKSWAEKASHGTRIVLDPQQNYESIELPPGLRKLNSEELKQHLSNNFGHLSISQNWPLAINQAITNQLLALRVEGQELAKLELVMPAEKNSLTPTRVIILMEEKAKLQLLQVALGAENSAHSHLLEIHLGKDSELNHGFVALGGGNASCLAQISVKQQASSNYSLTTIQHGWSLSRLEPEIIQVEGQGQTTLRGLQISTKKQQLATHSRVRFEGPEGCLNQLQKAAAIENSHSIFNGVIQVPQIAQKTNASQLSRNLLFSNQARIDTKPELEIVADDVRCAHGATISHLQEDELFYLRSRGIASNQARSLLLQGYCQEILEALPMEANRWDILNTLLESVQ